MLERGIELFFIITVYGLELNYFEFDYKIRRR